MCTLTLAWRVFPDAPIVAAANRDEATDRPSEPPARRRIPVRARTEIDSDSADEDGSGEVPEDDDATREIVAPRDSRAGGTWIGVNDAGVLVAITNRWLADPPEQGRSRGQLVNDCLERESAEDAARAVERTVRSGDYGGFNLIVADADAAILLEWDGQLATTILSPGVHVVVNVGGVVNDTVQFSIPGHRAERSEEQAHNARGLHELLRPEPGEAADDWLVRAGGALGDHENGVCVHGDGFGTRSSSLIRIGVGADPLANLRYEFADGSPCETPFEVVVDA